MTSHFPTLPEISERAWRILIAVSTTSVLLLTWYCLNAGITTIFMHLYYFPIVILAYRYRMRGFFLSVLLSLLYLAMVAGFESTRPAEITGAELRIISFVLIGFVVAYLSGIIEKSRREFQVLSNFNESIVSNANVWLAVLDEHGVISVWNRAAEDISGFTAAEVIGKNRIWKDLYPDAAYRKGVTATITKIIGENQVFENFETVIRTKSGGKRTIAWNTRTIPNDGGMPVRYVAIGIDVTVRKETEDALRSAYDRLMLKEAELQRQYDEMAKNQRALRESEAEYEAILHTAMDGFTIIDYTGSFLDANEAFCSMVGYTREEILASGISLVEARESPADVFRHMAEIQEKGSDRFETRYRRRDCTIIDVEVSVVRSETHGGHFVVFHHDITGRKQAEAALQRSHAELEERVRERTLELKEKNEQLELEIFERNKAEKQVMGSLHEKEILLREIHHRVKNNLQIVASLLNIQSRIIHDETTLNAIRDSQNRIRAMALVHEKLYRSGDISNIGLAEYTRFLADSLFSFYGTSRLAVQPIYSIGDVKVNIHVAIPLGLIINELVSNVLKHAFPDGKSGELTIAITQDDRNITLIVRDNGIGIPPYFDWRNAESLGLRLVIQLVDQLDGTIDLDRSAGTSFTVTIPKKDS